MSDFGERVDLTANLASILRRYPFSVGLFREIVQNSDDARATKQIFVLDRRQYGTSSLIRPALAHLQGPALLAYNDTEFSENDWEAIRTVSQSSKTTDTEKIGKHGLGSRAYYHLTDNPQYLSGSRLVIFDPHRWAFEHGGWREMLTNVASASSDQLEPFRSIGKDDVRDHFPGTIVRLPLRLATSQSRISSDRPSVDRIHNLLVDFIREELHIVMLFLRNLSTIEVREIDATGRQSVLATARVESQTRRLPLLSDKSATFTYEDRTVIVNYDITSVMTKSRQASTSWRLVRCSFPINECVELLSQALEETGAYIEGELAREKLRPDVALAFPESDASDLVGRLFTYLPLPLETAFPCHIHGVFSLTDSRQNLRNPSETILPGTADALAVAWNKMLFGTFIPRAWLAFLESIASENIRGSIYEVFPPRQDRKTSGDAKYWTSLLSDVVALASDRNAPVWPLCNPSDPTISYTTLDAVLIASQDDDHEHIAALVRAGIVIVVPHMDIHPILLRLRSSQRLTPQNARNKLLSAKSQLTSLRQSDRNLIADFLLRTSDLQHLIGLPLFPLVSGGATCLSAAPKNSQQRSHVLFDTEEADLFRSFDANAIALYELSPTTRRLLVDAGNRHLDVKSLDSVTAAGYVRSAHKKLSGQANAALWVSFFSQLTWSWDETCKWLGLFWEWIDTSCQFASSLLSSVKDVPLLPTSAGTLRTAGEYVFAYPPNLDDHRRDLLSRVGIQFLHQSIPSASLESRRPRLLRSATSPGDLLDALQSSPDKLIHGDAAVTLQAYMSSCLTINVSLTTTQKSTLRALPIHSVLMTDGEGLSDQLAALPSTHALYYLSEAARGKLPLPVVPNGIFIRQLPVQERLLEHVDYTAATHPLSIQQLLQLHVDNIVQQPASTHLQVLTFLLKNRSFRTSSLLEKIRHAPIVLLNRKIPLAAPKDVIDANSPLAHLLASGDVDAIFQDGGVNSKIVTTLASLGLLRKDLDAEYVEARICYISSLSSDNTIALDAARRLLRVWDKNWLNCSSISYDPDLAWIPTLAGLRRPQDCRDATDRMLFDRVMPCLDLEPLRSLSLRRALGWDEPIPLGTIVEQLKMVLAEADRKIRTSCLVALTRELGRRFQQLSRNDLDELVILLAPAEWVLTTGGALKQPCHAVFEVSSRLPGFGQIPLDMAEQPSVKEFLAEMGCATSPTNAAIIRQLDALALATPPSEDSTRDCIELLRALDFSLLCGEEHSRLWIPGNDHQLRKVDELFYNDLGFRAHQHQPPPNRVNVHPAVPPALRGELRIPSLGSLHLDPVEFEMEDMREDLTTRISNVLRSYDIEQTFNELLANAIDAGATKYHVLHDYDETRQAQPSFVLCEGMAQFCRGPALVAYNNSVFTPEDVRGICRIGRGGKEELDATIGRFGLGALSFYHFTEVAMILTGTYLILLDPSGRYLPEELKKNAHIMTIHNARSLYPGHLQVFDGLHGFQRDVGDKFDGTLIRLPLRTRGQALSSRLSKVSLSSVEVHRMIMRYQEVASRSLFFSNIDEIVAWRSDQTDSPLWSVSARRHPRDSDESYRITDIDLVDVPGRTPEERSKWRTVTTVIPPSAYPDWVASILAKHRMKQVNVALAGKISDRGFSSMQHKFFSFLPLPLMTSLPMHIHASFVLADDRRNIRWDGDGQLTPDSRFNHWLVSEVCPPLFLFALESWIRDFATSTPPWPGIMELPVDSLSRAVMDAFYEKHLFSSSRSIFRGMTGMSLKPSTAVFGGGQPEAIKELLLVLAPEEVVELPHRIRSKIFNLPAAKRVDANFVRELIIRKRHRFMATYSGADLLAKSIEGIVIYMLQSGHDPSSDLLSGLPLLPVADGTLSNITPWRGGINSSTIFSWRRAHNPLQLFPPSRFLHPTFDQTILLDKGLNVMSLEGVSVVALLRDIIPEGDHREVSTITRKWILDFWRFYDTISQELKLDQLGAFPLIPTMEETVFISLNKALALPVLNAPPPRTAWISGPLQKLGAVIIQRTTSESSRLPYIVQARLASIAFDFTGVVKFLDHVNAGGNIEERFKALEHDEHQRLATWIRERLGEQSFRNYKDRIAMDVIRRVPIWKGYLGGGGGSSLGVLIPLTNPSVRLLPACISQVERVAQFLGGTSGLYFVENTLEMSRLEHCKGISADVFSTYLLFPPRLPNDRSREDFKILLDGILLMSPQGLLRRLLVPTQLLTMVNVQAVYKESVAEFRAAFAHRSWRTFIHPQLRSYEDRLVAFGLRADLSCDNFKACAEAIDVDFADLSRAGDRERCMLIYRWYSTTLAMNVADDAWWRQLDHYAFIPRHASRRLGTATAFSPMAYALTLPDLVPPKKILRHELCSVAWTQRAFFPEVPDRRLYMSDELVGIPSVDDVVAHLRVLAIQIAPHHSGDSDLLEDLKATYEYLNERHEEARAFLLPHRREALFLNVHNPARDPWKFCPAAQIMFNVPDEDERQEVRRFLRPFRKLLLAAGAEEIKIPKAPVIPTSPAEDELARLRGSFDGLRQSGLLTDVTFAVPDGSPADGLRAHRVLLAPVSEYFHDLFCGAFAEGGPATFDRPTVVVLGNARELHCAGLILDHVYTGHFDEAQDRDCLLALLQLAHRWQMKEVQTKVEVLLVSTITPGTFMELRDYAEELGAQLLLDKVAEFERENKDALDQMIDWATPPASPVI